MINAIFEEMPEVWAGFFKDGFFGYGEKGDFQFFSLAHLIPVFLLIVAVILTYVFRNIIRYLKHEKVIRFVLACAMLLVELGYFWRLTYVGPGTTEYRTLLTKLPIQVCEWTCIFGALMVLSESKHLFDIDVFVCLTLGAVPLVIPTVILDCGPAYFRYYQFWGEHILPIYSVFYMMFVKGFKFDYKKVYKPLVYLAIICVLSVIANEAFAEYGANYLYLRRIGVDSIDSILPSNQFLRLVIYAPIVLILFGLETLIFALVRMKGRSKKREDPTASFPPLGNS